MILKGDKFVAYHLGATRKSLFYSWEIPDFIS